MILTVESVLYSLYKQIRDKSDDVIKLNYEIKPMTLEPDTSYLFIGGLFLFLCFVFKLYAAAVILDYTSIFVKRIGALENTQDEIYLINGNDGERNESPPLTPPPKYEQCALEFPSPPPYSVIHMC